MPSLADIPRTYRRYGVVKFAMRVYRKSMDDNVFTLASALAYSWLFALFPFLIFLLSFVPLVMSESSREDARKALLASVQQSGLPEKAAEPISVVVNDILGGDQGLKVGLLSIGLIVTIWVSSTGMATTMQAIDAAHDVRNPRSFIRQRLLAVALTIATASMVIAVLILVPIGTLVIEYISDHASTIWQRWGVDDKWLMLIAWSQQFLRYVLAFVLMFAILALVYHFGPNMKRKFRFITPGAVFCVIVWTLLAFTFSTYIERFGKYEKTYGAVGGVAIMLLLFYIDALVLLIGAEINGEMDAVVKGNKS